MVTAEKGMWSHHLNVSKLSSSGIRRVKRKFFNLALNIETVSAPLKERGSLFQRREALYEKPCPLAFVFFPLS